MSQLVWLRGKHTAQRAHCALHSVLLYFHLIEKLLFSFVFLPKFVQNWAQHCKLFAGIFSANCSTGDFLRIVHQDIFFKLFTERFLQIDHQEIYPAGRCDRASRQRLTTLQKISTSALFEILTNFC